MQRGDLPASGSRQAGRHDRFYSVADPAALARGSQKRFPGQAPMRPGSTYPSTTQHRQKRRAIMVQRSPNLKREGKLDWRRLTEVKYLNNVTRPITESSRLIAGARFQIDLSRLMPRSRDSKSARALRRTGSPSCLQPGTIIRGEVRLWRERHSRGPRR